MIIIIITRCYYHIFISLLPVILHLYNFILIVINILYCYYNFVRYIKIEHHSQLIIFIYLYIYSQIQLIKFHSYIVYISI